MDYLKFWSLRYSPFHCNGRFFFMGEAQCDAINQIAAIVRDGVRFATIDHSGGCGLSMLLRHVSETRGIEDHATEFVLTKTNPGNVRAIDALANDMRLKSADIEHNLKTTISSSARRGIHTVWLIDESAGLDARQAEALMKQLQPLAVIVGGRADGLTAAPDERIPLRPLQLTETRKFVQQSLRMAGCNGNPLSEVAITQIHQSSGGKIKAICELAEKTLMALASNRVRRRSRAA